MPDSSIARLQTTRVFNPISGTGSNTLFVEFGSEDDVATLRKYANNLIGNELNDPRMSNYIPKSLQQQHSSFQQVAFTARRATPKMSTKIWFGDTMQLRMKISGDKTPWLNVPPTNVEEFWRHNQPHHFTRPSLKSPIHQQTKNNHNMSPDNPQQLQTPNNNQQQSTTTNNQPCILSSNRWELLQDNCSS